VVIHNLKQLHNLLDLLLNEPSTPVNNVSAADETVITFQGNSLGINLIGVEGRTWVYRVREISGNDLSQWSIDIKKQCVETVSNNGEIKNRSVIWNVNNSFAEGLFAITTDADYPQGEVTASMKVGNKSGTGKVLGPVCNK